MMSSITATNGGRRRHGFWFIGPSKNSQRKMRITTAAKNGTHWKVGRWIFFMTGWDSSKSYAQSRGTDRIPEVRMISPVRRESCRLVRQHEKRNGAENQTENHQKGSAQRRNRRQVGRSFEVNANDRERRRQVRRRAS